MPMETFWFAAVAAMLAIYVVLDGFDLGTGIVHLIVGRSEVERRTTLSAIGPVWDGNEVWLVAGGGVLFFAFPRVYAVSFSGFYLALILVLWLLMFRALSIKLRSHFNNSLWRVLWDKVFALSSLLLAMVLGAALGNLIRGVPINPEGYFFVAFWTDLRPGPHPGIFDWYTVFMALTAAAILAAHGANYLAMKTEDEIQARARRVAGVATWLLVVLIPAALAITAYVQPALRPNYDAHPVGYVLPAGAGLALIAMVYLRRRQRDVGAFVASSLFILGMLTGAAWGMYPRLLIATTDAARSLTIHNAAVSSSSLRLGFLWFGIGISLAVAYTVHMHRAFWGKVEAPSETEDY